jgi:hypothetical protein
MRHGLCKPEPKLRLNMKIEVLPGLFLSLMIWSAGGVAVADNSLTNCCNLTNGLKYVQYPDRKRHIRYVIANHALIQVTPGINKFLSDIDVLPNGDIRVVWAAEDDLAGELNIYALTFTPP